MITLQEISKIIGFTTLLYTKSFFFEMQSVRLQTLLKMLQNRKEILQREHFVVPKSVRETTFRTDL